MALVNGMADFSSTRIDTAYREWDEEFPQREEVLAHLPSVQGDWVTQAGSHQGHDLSRSPVFYSLALVLDGLKRIPTKAALERALADVDARFNDPRPPAERPEEDLAFVAACTASTQRIRSRQTSSTTSCRSYNACDAPSLSIAVPYLEFTHRCGRHSQVVGGLPQVDPELPWLDVRPRDVAYPPSAFSRELVMMRLFDEFQDALAGIALRLACGAPYADGSAPLLLTSAARSTGGRERSYEQHGRPTAKFMKWSKVTYINETTRYVLDTNNPL